MIFLSEMVTKRRTLARRMRNPTPATERWGTVVIIIKIRTISLIRNERKFGFRRRKYVGSTLSRKIGTTVAKTGTVTTAKIRPCRTHPTISYFWLESFSENVHHAVINIKVLYGITLPLINTFKIQIPEMEKFNCTRGGQKIEGPHLEEGPFCPVLPVLPSI